MLRSKILASLLVASLAFPASASTQTGGGQQAGSDCRQFLQAVEIAADQAPKGTTQARAVQAAQDEVVITLFWVHGYISGQSGQVPALDSAWMGGTVSKLSAICRAEGASQLPISEAVKKL